MYQARSNRTKSNLFTLMKHSGLEFIIFDTETTGLDKNKDFIMELAAIKYWISKQSPVEIERLNLYIRPPFYMDEKIVAIHGISNQFLESKPTEKHVIAEINSFFGDYPIVMGYNIGFNVGMMEGMYGRNGLFFTPQVLIDVMEMGRDILKDMPNYKLGTLVEELGLASDLHFHNALADAIATYRLMMYCYNEYKSHADSNIDLQDVYVNTIYFRKGFRKEQSGVYLKTNLGIIFLARLKNMVLI